MKRSRFSNLRKYALFLLFLSLLLLVLRIVLPMEFFDSYRETLAVSTTNITFVVAGSLFITSCVGLISFSYRLWWRKKQEKVENSSYVQLSIAPKVGVKQPKNPDFWRQLVPSIQRLGDGPSPHISWEISGHQYKTVFTCYIPEELEDEVKTMVSTQWPETEIRRVVEKKKDIGFVDKGVVLQDTLMQAMEEFPKGQLLWFDMKEIGDDMFPMITDEAEETSIVPSLISNVYKLPQDSWAGIQFLIRPAPRNTYKKLQARLRKLAEKISPPVDPFSGKKPRRRESNLAQLRKQQKTILERIEGQLLFEVHIRVWMWCDPEKLEHQVLDLTRKTEGVFYGGQNRLQKKGKGGSDFETIYHRTYPFSGGGALLDYSELSKCCRLPSSEQTEKYNQLHQAGSKNLQPAHIALRRKSDTKGYVVYGRPVMEDKNKNNSLYVARKLEFTHTFIAGVTGTGKSTSMVNHAVDNFRNGTGQVVIDPHSDFINDIIAVVPPNELHRLGYVDPRKSQAVRMNLCETGKGKDVDLSTRVELIMNAVRTAMPANWDGSTNMQALLGNSIRLAIAGLRDPDVTAIDRIMRDEDFRTALMHDLADEISVQRCIQYWTNTWDSKTEKDQASLLDITGKRLNAILDRDPIRRCIGMKGSTIHLADYLNNGKTLLVALNDSIGVDSKKILVGMFFQQVYAIASQRQYLKAEDRPESAMLVDEFHDFVVASGGMVGKILAEVRKYKHEMILATQFFGQLAKDPEVYEAVMSNCLTKLVYRLQALKEQKDAVGALGTPSLTPIDIRSIRRFHAYCSLYVNRNSLPAALVQMSPPAEADWTFPKGIGYEATGINMPDQNWEGLTIATSGSLKNIDISAGFASSHPAEKLKHARVIASQGTFSDSIRFLAGLSDSDWQEAWHEQIKIDKWQARTLTKNISPLGKEDYVETVKKILSLRDGIRKTMSEAEFYRQQLSSGSSLTGALSTSAPAPVTVNSGSGGGSSMRPPGSGSVSGSVSGGTTSSGGKRPDFHNNINLSPDQSPNVDFDLSDEDDFSDLFSDESE